MKFVKDIIITFATRISVVALSLGASVIVARILGPEGKGAFSLVLLVPGLLAMAGNLGIGISNAYFGGKRKYALSDLTSNSLVSALGLGIMLAVVFLVYFFIFQPSFLNDVMPQALVLAMLLLPITLLLSYFNQLLLGQNKIKEINLVSLAQAGIAVPLMLLLLLVIKADVFNATIAQLAAIFVAAVLSILLVRQMTKIKLAFHPLIFKESIKFGSKGYLGNIIQYLNYRLDMLLVALFMNVGFVGYYSAAVPLAEALWYLPTAVGMVIFARTIGLSAEEANKSTPRICRNTIFLTVLAGILLLVLGKYLIILLYGRDFLPALPALQILIPGVIALSICKVLGNEIVGRGKPGINTINAAISLAVNIPLNIVLIPRIGIAGAALASTISYTCSAIFSIVIFMKISGVRCIDLIILKAEDLKIYRQIFSGVYSLSLDRDRRNLAIQEILLESNPRSWGKRGDETGDAYKQYNNSKS